VLLIDAEAGAGGNVETRPGAALGGSGTEGVSRFLVGAAAAARSLFFSSSSDGIM